MVNWYEFDGLVRAGRKADAVELLWSQAVRRGEYHTVWYGIRDYKIPRQYLSTSRRKEMYRALSKTDFLKNTFGQAKLKEIEEMVSLGLLTEASEALANSNPDSVELLTLADLYRRTGKWTAAAEIYEVHPRISEAVECYKKDGRADMVAHYLLGESKVDEAIAVFREAGDQDGAKWVQLVAQFSLASFVHPLSASDQYRAPKSQLFWLAGDEYHRMLHELTDNSELPQRRGLARLELEGIIERLFGKSFLFGGRTSRFLLPVEGEHLSRVAGRHDLAEKIASDIKTERHETKYPPTQEYWWNTDTPVITYYILSGQFFRAIFLGRMECGIAERHKKLREREATITGVALSYEAVGAFADAARWLDRMLPNDRGLARLHLKQGAFAQAAGLLEKTTREEKYGVKRIEDAIVIYELYRISGNRSRSEALLSELITESREKGEVVDLVRKLENYGLYEESAEICKVEGVRHEGPKHRPEERSVHVRKGEAGEPITEDGNAGSGVEGKLVCQSCGGDVKASWKICPECDSPLGDTRCRCGEPLKPHWSKCPACLSSVNR